MSIKRRNLLGTFPLLSSMYNSKTMSLMKGTATLVLILVCVYTERVASDSEVTLPATERQLKNLATGVCNELFFFKDKHKASVCAERFLHSAKSSSSSSLSTSSTHLELVCQSQQKVMFRITPSRGIRLVVLLPEDGNVLIGFKLLPDYPDTSTTDFIPIRTKDHYSLWTTTLDPDGTPSTWHKGPDVPWMTHSQDYQIHVAEPSFEYNQEKNNIDATFRINIGAAPNACADVTITNVCNKLSDGRIFMKRIKLTNQTVSIRGLPADDECTMSVHHDKERTGHKYRTPWCTKLAGCLPPPEKPENIHLEAIEAESGVGWDVLVAWDKPKLTPELFNVTLYADEVRGVILEGNITQVTFENVKGEGLYNVSIETIAVNGQRAWNTARTFFPVVAWSRAQLALWGAAGALLAVLATGLCWARHSYHTHRKDLDFLQTSEITDPKECGVEPNQAIVEDSWEVKWERLLVHEIIGEGAFGVVRRGTLAPDGKDVAIKMLKEFPTLEEMRAFRKEMDLMKNVGAHPHVVSLVGCCSGRRPLIVAEYCSRGDLLSFLRCCWDVMVSKHNVKYYNNINNNEDNFNYRNDLFTNNRQHRVPNEKDNFVVNKMYDLQSVCDADLTSSDLLSFCRQIAMGMEFLASNRLVHRDLAARNILVTKDKMLKIADFGLSRDVYTENQYKQKGNGKMPVKWMALESLTHRIYTTMTDVWSFGVVMWEISTIGGAPYPDVPADRVPRLLRAGYRLPRPHNCTKPLYDLMLECWRPRPKERPTFAELYQKLDELLNSACAEEYLTLEVDGDDRPVSPKPQKYAYLKKLLRGNRVWAWSENYEQPWKASQNNHYTKPPAFAKPIAV